jgi:hypothetical protein
MWVLPTRSRLDNCIRFIENWKSSNSNSDVYVRLDKCDPHLETLINLDWPKNFTIGVGERQGVAKAVNELYLKYPNELWYGFIADDFSPKTPNWDQRLILAAGNSKISYPNDCMGEKVQHIPTLFCVGGDLVREIGWFGLPDVHHFYVDTVWRFIGDHLNNIFRLEDVIVEHLHYSAGKSEFDEVYATSSSQYKSDKAKYNNWCKLKGTVLVERLKKKKFNIID